MGLLILLPAAFVLAALLWAFLPTCYYKFFRSNALPQAKHEIALSFDDGPDARYTPQLLDLLRAEDVRASFFVSGAAAAAQPQLIQRMRDEGHSVGLHGYSHANNWLLGPRAAARELENGLATLRGLGVEPACYRPPYGNITPLTLLLTRRHGLRLTLWTVMAQDWRGDAAADILARLRRRTKAGSVICLHDGCAGAAVPDSAAATLQALRIFLPEMKTAGYRFVTLADLAGAETTRQRTEVRYGNA